MKGCRPLTDAEIKAVLDELERGRFPARDRALFLVGLSTGFRISELVSLRLRDMYQNGRFVTRVHVQRKNMKNEVERRPVPLHPEAIKAIKRQVHELEVGGHSLPETFFFLSRQGENCPINRRTGWRILTDAFDACAMTGKLATHSMRKTFAQRVYRDTGENIFKLQQAMGHRDPKSTVAYLSFDENEIDKAILKSSLF